MRTNDGESVDLDFGDPSANYIANDRLLDVGKNILQIIGTINAISVRVNIHINDK